MVRLFFCFWFFWLVGGVSRSWKLEAVVWSSLPDFTMYLQYELWFWVLLALNCIALD
ncbi:hypothetical protein BO99DRAFT_402138 [Aspergillus violaceofuscus CBS 115571]|uniref:Uncharacterized protein n=1 Tax=Aspergillus violaceofuscus (strain CBS 115571) TaxID=1450538 RepID=A0A2V5IK12_ASPV1|nr:hypothetical protein BO99DRAFT_402138 [Aspergillus violaceofuscus CBS 115571]